VKVRLAFDDWKDGQVAPATFELPVPKRAEAGAFRAHLGKFELFLDPPAGPGGPGGGVRLVTDAAAGPRESWPTVRISEKQAAAVIDYLDRNKLFEEMYDPPPGFPHPGRYVHLRGVPYFDCSWRFPPDADLASVGLFRHLVQTLDGDARAAVEKFVRAGGAKKE